MHRHLGAVGQPEPGERGARGDVPFGAVSGRRRSDSATSSTRRRHDELRVGVGEHEPDLRRTAAPSRAVSSPSTRTVPDEGRTRPLSSRASVDLPEPLAPTIAMRRSVSSRVTGPSSRTTRSAPPAGSGLYAVTRTSSSAIMRPGQRRERSMSGNALKIAAATAAAARFLITSPGQYTTSMARASRNEIPRRSHQADDAGRVDGQEAGAQAGERPGAGTATPTPSGPPSRRAARRAATPASRAASAARRRRGRPRGRRRTGRPAGSRPTALARTATPPTPPEKIGRPASPSGDVEQRGEAATTPAEHEAGEHHAERLQRDRDAGRRRDAGQDRAHRDERRERGDEGDVGRDGGARASGAGSAAAVSFSGALVMATP